MNREDKNLKLSWKLIVLCAAVLLPSLKAQDVPILRKNMWEAGGFTGASYGVDKARVMGGGNVTYSLFRAILPYVEFSDFPSIQRTFNNQDTVIHYDVPITDVNFGIHARFLIPKTRIVPYAVLGAGLLHASSNTNTFTTPQDAGGFKTVRKFVDPSTDFAVNFGGGIRVYLKEQFGIRGEFKAYELTSGALKKNLGYDRLYRATFGIFWQFGGR